MPDAKQQRGTARARIQRYYDEIHYSSSDARETTSGAHWTRLARRLRLTPGTSLLDIGCGVGGWLLAARRHGSDICGIDISTTALKRARIRLGDAKLVCGAAEALPVRNASFDIVTCLGSLEHFVDPGAGIEEMVRVAKPGAYVLILVPNRDFLTRRLRLFGGTAQIEAKEDARSLQQWALLFERFGLVIEKRWRDLHVMSLNWISAARWPWWPLRALQAGALCVWPLRWQYQVYHLCRVATRTDHRNGRVLRER